MNAARVGLPFVVFFVAACGSAASVVGGRCLEGFEAIDGRCVPLDPSGSTNTTPIPSATTHRGPDTGPFDPVPPRISGQKPVQPYEPVPQVIPPLEPPVDPPLTCSAPLVACAGSCLPVDDDPQNCGACGKVCAAGICVAGECQGSTPGGIVVLGHDYSNTWYGTSPAKVLRNAVSIPTSNPIRILSYETGAPAATVSATKYNTQQPYRTVQYFTAASDASLEFGSLHLWYDIVMIHDAAGADPTARGSAWAPALDTFTRKGGIVIAISGGASDMPTLLASAALLPTSGQVSFPAATQFVVSSPGDAVGVQVSSPYAALTPAFGFTGLVPTPGINWVVRQKTNDNSGLPIVIHRSVP